MAKENLTLQEAAELSGKSVQTIRRAIKSKKLRVRKQKTAQGFNYLVQRDSLCSFYNLRFEEPKAKPISVKKTREHFEKQFEARFGETSENNFHEQSDLQQADNAINSDVPAKETMAIDTADFKSFVQTMQAMMEKHSEERRNFLKLVDSLQERVFVLENQLNLLKAPVQKKWFAFWK